MNPADAIAPVPADPDRRSARALLVLALALLPALAAIAIVPEFSTQDGPAHLYNARILGAALRSRSPYAGVYEVNLQPVPNWAGHLVTMAAVAILPLDLAARAITAGTLVALVGAIVWMRWRVAGSSGFGLASVLATLLGLNVAWLFGFTSFLLGAALFPITLASWWHRRDHPGLAVSLRLAVLLVLGYLCHPISLGMTVLGLAVLALTTPGPKRSRILWTVAALAPLVPLGLTYVWITRSGGGLEPTWEHLTGRWTSPAAWVEQLSWVDPLSLAAKTFRPLGGSASRWNGLFAPAAWTTLGIAFLIGATWRSRHHERRGWLILAVLILAGGVSGPDTLGVKHGHYMPQRLTLLGLIALVPWLNLELRRWAAFAGSAMLVLALVIQSVFVWEYALDCRDRLGSFRRIGSAIGANQRVGTLVVDTRGRFLSNPLLHADCLFGIDPPNILWGNYETDHYYFPVRVRAGVQHPRAKDFENVSLMDGPAGAETRSRLWETLLRDHGAEIDVLIQWQTDPSLDAITERWYRPGTRLDRVQTWIRRESVESRP